MLFSSLTFLLLFIPILLILYLPIKNITYRNVVLFIMSLLFYSWGEPYYILLMLFSIVNDYTHSLFIDKFKNSGNDRGAKILLISSICINLGLLGFFKYTNFIIENMNAILSLDITPKNIVLPIGISFYTFQTMSYTIDVYRGNVKAQRNMLIVATYVTMFPQLIAGPIVRYIDIETELQERELTFDLFLKGTRRFIIGLAKKVIISNNVAILAVLIIDQEHYDSIGFLAAWFGIIAYALQIYFDFSGYSDMAIGLGQMMGFNYLENFNHPYESRSITDFWRRWHISLGTWFREYVYIPLGGNRVSKVKFYRNIFIVWFLTGLWHGASWNFVLWGLYFGVILVIEKNFLLKYLNDSKFRIPSHIYALILICVGWVFFRIEDLNMLFTYMGKMFSVFNLGDLSVVRGEKETYLVIFIILGMIGSTHFIKSGLYWFETKNAFTETIYNLFTFAIFVISITYLVSGTYNPFIYFQF